MQTTDLDRRFRAVEKLQSIRDRYRPGSYEFDKADYAIDLALSPGRPASDFLVPNTLRDAANILRRRAKNGPTFVSLDAVVSMAGDDGEEDCTFHDLLASRIPTPAEECSENDFVATLGCKVGADASAPRRALWAMLNGESAADFGRATGFSESYLKKLRHEVRTAAQKLN
jgi:hypothetical protein